LGFRVWGLGFGVQGSGFRVWGSGFGVQGLGFRVWGSGFGVQGLGFRVWGSRFGVQGLAFMVWRSVVWIMNLNGAGLAGGDSGNHVVYYGPFIKSQLASTQLTSGPYVKQIWSRPPEISGSPKP